MEWLNLLDLDYHNNNIIKYAVKGFCLSKLSLEHITILRDTYISKNSIQIEVTTTEFLQNTILKLSTEGNNSYISPDGMSKKIVDYYPKNIQTPENFINLFLNGTINNCYGDYDNDIIMFLALYGFESYIETCTGYEDNIIEKKAEFDNVRRVW